MSQTHFTLDNGQIIHFIAQFDANKVCGTNNHGIYGQITVERIKNLFIPSVNNKCMCFCQVLY